MKEIVEKAKAEATFEKILYSAMRSPGVKINRAKFLRKELKKYYPEDVIKEAIRTNPANAGVSRECVNRISKQIINYETTKVTGISVAASLPGGAAAVVAAGTDITSYFASILRIVQQLAYLYGFDDFNLNEDEVDAETMNGIMLFVGVMFGVQGAAVGLHKLADILARHIAKKLAKKALTKGVVYPIVKKVSVAVGIRMTKQIFADTVASAVPVAGGVISGGLTYAMFKPCCLRLKRNLMKYNLCDPDFYRQNDPEVIIDVDSDSIDEV